MKAKVIISRFRDKYTKKVYTAGDMYEGSKERIEELQAKKWLGEVEEIQSVEETYLSTLNGTVDEIKTSVDGLKKSDYEKLIELEEQGKNRKSLIEFLQEQAGIAGLAETPNEEGE